MKKVISRKELREIVEKECLAYLFETSNNGEMEDFGYTGEAAELGNEKGSGTLNWIEKQYNIDNPGRPRMCTDININGHYLIFTVAEYGGRNWYKWNVTIDTTQACHEIIENDGATYNVDMSKSGRNGSNDRTEFILLHGICPGTSHGKIIELNMVSGTRNWDFQLAYKAKDKYNSLSMDEAGNLYYKENPISKNINADDLKLTLRRTNGNDVNSSVDLDSLNVIEAIYKKYPGLRKIIFNGSELTEFTPAQLYEGFKTGATVTNTSAGTATNTSAAAGGNSAVVAKEAIRKYGRLIREDVDSVAAPETVAPETGDPWDALRKGSSNAKTGFVDFSRFLDGCVKAGVEADQCELSEDEKIDICNKLGGKYVTKEEESGNVGNEPNATATVQYTGGTPSKEQLNGIYKDIQATGLVPKNFSSWYAILRNAIGQGKLQGWDLNKLDNYKKAINAAYNARKSGNAANNTNTASNGTAGTSTEQATTAGASTEQATTAGASTEQATTAGASTEQTKTAQQESILRSKIRKMIVEELKRNRK